MSFAKFIGDFRKEKNLTQNQAAELFGVSNTTIKDIENGKTTFPNMFLLDTINKYFGRNNELNTTYEILFNDESDPGYNFEEKYKLYFAQRKNSLYHVDIDYPCKNIDGSTKNLLGVIWVPKITYYKIIVADYNQDKFYKAIKNLDKNPDALIHTIITETKFFDNIKDKKQYKDIRFILDKKDNIDCEIFKEIRKIKIPNLGKYADISFQLFDQAVGSCNDKDIYYITDHKSKNKMIH